MFIGDSGEGFVRRNWQHDERKPLAEASIVTMTVW
jgi:hypothetical protein